MLPEPTKSLSVQTLMPNSEAASLRLNSRFGSLESPWAIMPTAAGPQGRVGSQVDLRAGNLKLAAPETVHN
jgi:hypothetical protein